MASLMRFARKPGLCLFCYFAPSAIGRNQVLHKRRHFFLLVATPAPSPPALPARFVVPLQLLSPSCRGSVSAFRL